MGILYNLRQIKYNKMRAETKERLQLENFLPGAATIELGNKSETEQRDNDRIRVAIFHWDIYMYNMIHSLYREFQKCENIDCDVILVANKYGGSRYRECADSLKKRNIPFKYDFDCINEKYDVLIIYVFIAPPSRYQKMIRENSRYCIAMPSNEYNPNFMISFKDGLMTWNPDAVFCEKWQTEACQQYFNFPFYNTGNVKYDLIYETINSEKKDYPGNFAKLKQSKFKKVFLYITDHDPNNLAVSESVSFDLYAKTIFSFFERNRDCCLIFRPYTAYIEERIEHGMWTREDVLKLKEYFNKQENFVWDDEDHDSIAMSFADAMISDAFSGLATHALPAMKPIAIPLRWDMKLDRLIENKDLKERSYYYIRSEEEMNDFMQMVLNGENPKIEGMKSMFDKAVTFFDGKIAERMRKIIERDFV